MVVTIEALQSAAAGNSDGARAGEVIKTDSDATWVLTSAFIIFTMQSGELSGRNDLPFLFHF